MSTTSETLVVSTRANTNWGKAVSHLQKRDLAQGCSEDINRA